MKFGFLNLKVSCAVFLLAAAGANAKTYAQKSEPESTPVVVQTSAQLSAEKETQPENKEIEKTAANVAVHLEDLIHLGDVIEDQKSVV